VTVTNADGSKPRVILPDPFIGGSADWSPDSRSMALVTPTMTGPDALLIAAADGSGARMVPLDGIRPRNAVFNPLNDGTLLVRGDLAGITYLFLVDLDGQILRRYDLPGSMVFGAEWEFAGATFSPDGKTIVYNSVENGPNGVRFLANVINTDGTNRRVVPLPVDPAGNYSQAWPVFSPDGKWIAMESWVGIPGSPATNQIAIVPADGSAPAHGVGPKLENQSLLKTWSPDGRTIIVTSVDRNQAYQVDVASGAWSILPWSSDMPDWQRLAL
jgi:Tol biopolymer transport system component